MTFVSVLFAVDHDSDTSETSQPPYFHDLNLDQVVAAIVAGREEYNLKPFFHTPLRDADAVAYRHEVMQDIEADAVSACVESFAQTMREMRASLAEAAKARYERQRQRWFLTAIGTYCAGVRRLERDLTQARVRSRALLSLCSYVSTYCKGKFFSEELLARSEALEAELSAVRYCVLTDGNEITVRAYEGQADYRTEVERTFERFERNSTKDHRVAFPPTTTMNHVEARILDYVALLYPLVFAALEDFCAVNIDYVDAFVARFDREIQFYLAYRDFIAPIRRGGLSFCYPLVSSIDKSIYDNGSFDLALAAKLTSDNLPVVCNDFRLGHGERIIVVTGPNQGGKTTFARAFGQAHFLAAVGCQVPGREAKLFLCDRIFTHFEKEESIETLRGKLEDDLVRVHYIIERATADSIVIMNEIFTSTTLQDAITLSERVLSQLAALGVLGIWVTFIEELARAGAHVVSMVGAVAPDDPARRTYELLRRPPNGMSYAMSIAEKYGLTYERLKGRIDP